MSVSDREAPEIRDWHAHIYFDLATRDSAWALRERIEKSFDIQMGRFHEKPVGPHPRFSYQVHFRNDQLAPLISWLTLHRGDLMHSLEQAVPAACVFLGRKLVRLATEGKGFVLHFADGTEAKVDALIGADGIHSVVRSLAFGKYAPQFAGFANWRAILPRAPSLERMVWMWGKGNQFFYSILSRY